MLTGLLNSIVNIVSRIQKLRQEKYNAPRPKIELIDYPWKVTRSDIARNALVFQNNGETVTLLSINDPDKTGITTIKRAKCKLENGDIFSVECPSNILECSRGKKVVLIVKDSFNQKYSIAFVIKEGFPRWSMKRA